jgi:RecA-family ATPase
MVGKGTVIAAYDSKSGLVQPTPVLTSVRNMIESYHPGLVIMGNRVNIFGVNQNEDQHAAQCMQILNALQLDFETTIIMPGHVSVRGQGDESGGSGSGSSGSVQWSNGLRHRIVLTKPKKDDDSRDESYNRTLEVLKSNDAPTGVKIEMHWSKDSLLYVANDEHVTVSERERPLTQQEMEINVEQEVLRMVRLALEMGQRLSTQPRANNGAATVFAEHPDCKYRGKRPLLAAAIERLFKQRKLVAKPYGPKSDHTSMIMLAEDGNVVQFPHK